jgi:fermentation-respiration switch protein FrsA (DUF1100 family)
MKTITIFLIMFFCFGLAFGQDITGTWNGVLKVQGMQLRIVFHIDKTDNGYKSTMDSPDQGAKGIPVNNTMLADNTVSLSITMAGIDYSGVLEGNNIKGTFKQGGMEIPLELTRGVVEKEPVKRSQDPKQPYPYHSEEVKFRNEGANITLAGTLTLPKKDGVFPVVVLISGSGPQNRNEEVFNHRPFLVLSDHLTRNGIAVLRFDDRGVGESEGDFSKATSADFAMDVMSAVAYLETRKEINKKKIGLIGHSEGGLIAPMVATQSKDIGFIVLLAGPGIRGDKLLYEQSRLIAAASGIPDDLIERTSKTNSTIYELIVKSTDNEKLKVDLKMLLESIPAEDFGGTKPNEEMLNAQIAQMTSPWMTFFLKYDPAPTLEKVKCAVLAVNGEKDLQVPSKMNLKAIEQALKKGGNKSVTTIELPGLNHIFQECSTGSPSEYALIEQTFSPSALNEITQWIANQTK